MTTSAQDSSHQGRAAIPYLCALDAASAIDFYKAAFGAAESGERFMDASGKVGHAELTVEGARFYLADEFHERDFLSPQTLGGTPVTIVLEVDDVDAVAATAIAAGAKVLRPVEDQFYGSRAGWFLDPYGHRWTLSTQIREMSADEVRTAAEQYLQE